MNINNVLFFLVPVQKIKHAKKKEEDKTYIPEPEEDIDFEEEEDEDEEEEIDENASSSDEGTNSHEEEISEPSQPLIDLVKQSRKVNVKKRPLQKQQVSPPVTMLTAEKPEKKQGRKRKMEKNEVSGMDVLVADPKNDSKKEKKEPLVFNDKNVDYNLYHEAPENVATKKIKLSSNVLLVCKMIEATGDQKGLTYDYAALSIVRKTKNNTAYEFNLPLTIAPNLKKGIELIIKDNHHFFQLKNNVSAT